MAAESPDPSSSEVAAMTSFIEEETMREVMAASEESFSSPNVQAKEKGAKDAPEAEMRQHEQELMKQGLHVPSLAPTAASLGIRDIVEECNIVSEEHGQVGGELDLEGIDEKELDELLLSEAEVKIKTEIWMRENKDYLFAQKEREEKRLREEQEHGSKPEKRKRKYKKREKIVTEASSAKEAVAMVIQEKKLSRKINYEVLEDLRCKDKQSKSSTLPDTTGSGTVTASEPTSSQSILKMDSCIDKGERLASFEDSEEGEPPAKRKSVLIQEPAPWREEQLMLEVAASPPVVVETGPVQYAEEQEFEPATEEEEEEEDHIIGHELFGRDSVDDDDHYYDDSD